MTPKQKAPEKAQRQYDIVMLQVRGMIFSEFGIKAVVEQIQSAEGGPAKGIGYTAAMLMKSVSGALKKKGKKVSPEILKGAFAETVADLVEVAVAAKVIGEKDKQAVGRQALAEGAKVFKEASQPAGQSPRGPMLGAQPPAPEGGIVQTAMGA